MEKNRGITLIALIITIIIMLILVAVTIQVVVNSGLLDSASKAGKNYQAATENEANLEKVTINGKEYNSIDEYIKDKNELGPVITDVIVTNKTTNKIEIEVETVKAEGATFTYTYRIKGEKEWQSPEETEVNGNTCKFINLADQTVYEIKVEVTSKNGTAEKIIEEQTGELETGTITFSDPTWTNGIAKVTATNTATEYQMQYQVNGITEGQWTNIENIAEIGGLKHGDTVYARIWDGTNGTKPANASIQDLNPPEVETFTVTAHDTTTISVSATATDSKSGIKSYEFQYKEKSASVYTTATTTETSNGTCTYQYIGLADDTTYNLRVVVTDKANNPTTSTVLTQATEPAIKPKVGDFVNYTPKSETTYKVGSESTGYTLMGTQTFTPQAGLQWRILSIDEAKGTMELVSATQTTSSIYFQGATGYNHSVDILNDLCKDLYSNNEINATARSMNMADIIAKTKKKQNEIGGYGTTKYQMSTFGSANNHPNIYKREDGHTSSGITGTGLQANQGLNNRVKNATTGISTYADATIDANGGFSPATYDMYATLTYIQFKPEDELRTDLGVNNAVQGLFNTNNRYWLASRCVGINPGFAYFYLQNIFTDGMTTGDVLYLSSNYSDPYGYPVRPVVNFSSRVNLTLDSVNTIPGYRNYWNIT